MKHTDIDVILVFAHQMFAHKTSVWSHSGVRKCFIERVSLFGRSFRVFIEVRHILTRKVSDSSGLCGNIQPNSVSISLCQFFGINGTVVTLFTKPSAAIGIHLGENKICFVIDERFAVLYRRKWSRTALGNSVRIFLWGCVERLPS